MATILIHNEENTLLESEQEVAAYLENQGVIYEHWDIAKLPNRLSEKYDLTDEEKEEILTVFQKEIESISEKRGYKAQDVISLSDDTPNLDDLLQNFQREHHHTDDEVRFIVSGHGIFAIQGKDVVTILHFKRIEKWLPFAYLSQLRAGCPFTRKKRFNDKS
jgi:1,2-dihydroxy-3-keto-5-methylthiopentene dioxygenase